MRHDTRQLHVLQGKTANPILQGAGPVEDHDRDFSFCSRGLGLAGS